MHGVTVRKPQAPAAAHATAYAAVTRMKNGGKLVRIDHVINRPCHFVVGVTALRRRMKFKSPDALLLDQSFCFARTEFAFVRINAGEGNHHVAVIAGCFGNFLVRYATPAHVRLGIHREHHQSELAFSVISHCFFDGRASV